MKRLPRRTILKGMAAAPFVLTGRSSWGAAGAPTMMSEVDIDAAKAEGTMTLYTSLDTKIVDSIIGPFKEKYGITVEYFRGSSGDVTGKVLAEADAGRIQADMVDASDLGGLLVMKERGLLLEKKSEASAVVPPNLQDPDGTWMADRLTQAVIQYNTNEFGGDKAPKTWQDLTAPEYKGRLVFSSSANGDGAPRLYTLAKAFGWELLEAYAANDPIRSTTPQLITQILESGEGGAAFATNDNIAWRSKQGGKPTDYVYPAGRRAHRAGRHGPHQRCTAPERGVPVPRVLDEQGGAGASGEGRQIFQPHRRRAAHRQPAAGYDQAADARLQRVQGEQAGHPAEDGRHLRRRVGDLATVGRRFAGGPGRPEARPVATLAHEPPRRRNAIGGSTLVFGLLIVLLLFFVGYPLLWLLLASFGVPNDFQLGHLARVYSRRAELSSRWSIR